MTRARRTDHLAARRRTRRAPLVAALLAALVATLPGGAGAEQASQPTSPAAGYLTTGAHHSCAVVIAGVRCWGYGGDGQLGYGNRDSIGDDDEPGAFGPVDLGAGRSPTAISAGNVHTCALLDDGSVRCWGFGGNGRLGYGNTSAVGDDEAPGAVGPVDLGGGLTAKAVTAGDGHSCAVLSDDGLRCWGFGLDGRLGYNATDDIGDDEPPGTAGPVDFGPGLTVKAVSAGGSHTCALLSDDSVRCWGFGGNGRLGYGNIRDVGRGCVVDPATNRCDPTPDAPATNTVGPVDLGSGRTATAISAGFGHTCAVLDDGTVRCWGSGLNGRLGYGNTASIGDNETPGSVAPVDLGPGRTAQAISVGGEHTCALLDDGTVRCWGNGSFGRLGYGNTAPVGDNETPGSVGPVELGPGRTATAISAGALHTCARLDDGSVRCWGYGPNGRLGYCDEVTIGNDESPASVGPVPLGQPGIVGDGCPVVAPPPPPPPPPAAPPPPPAAAPPAPPAPPPPAPPAPDPLAVALAAERSRAVALRGCLGAATAKLRSDRRRARTLPRSRARIALRRADKLAGSRRSSCLRRHARVPGRVSGLAARAAGRGRIRLSFRAAGTDGGRAPAARSYVIKQSRRPIRSARDFARAPALCDGSCSFRVTAVGADVKLTITDLRPRRRLYFAVAARDNVSGLKGRRTTTTARAG